MDKNWGGGGSCARSICNWGGGGADIAVDPDQDRHFIGPDLQSQISR